jgi:hypothetical protein
MEQDVVAVGSGAGALTAVAAAPSGSRRRSREGVCPGGTGAMSGGVAWIPNNPHIRIREQDSLSVRFSIYRASSSERLRPDP